MRLLKLSLAIVLMACGNLAFAQHPGCPPGYTPVGGGNTGFSGCAPNYDPGLPANAPLPSPPDPGPRWDFRWGVIVVDPVLGKFGASDGNADPRKAQRAAIKQCKQNGGKSCKVFLEYFNQCGVLVAGNSHKVAQGGAVVEEAKKRALAQCSAVTDNCQVYYAGCSYPVEK